MNALEALEAAAQTGSVNWSWARPITWRGTGRAICYDQRGGWLVVPSARGGNPALLPSRYDLMSDWELISPEVVNTELP